MKFLSPLVVMFLLMGCTTNNFMVSDELASLCSKCKSIEKAEAVPVEPTSTPTPTPTPVPQQSMNIPLEMFKQGWRQSSKAVLCGPPEQVLASVKSYGERPYMYWQDPNLNTSVMVFRNLENNSLTVIENPDSRMSCILSNGTELHIEEDPIENGKLREAGKEKVSPLLEIKEKRD